MRISCNPSVVQRQVTPLDAIVVLERLTQLGVHTFWPLDQSILRLRETIGVRLQGYRQMADAVLLMAVMQHDGQLATFDTAMEGLVRDNERESSLYESLGTGRESR